MTADPRATARAIDALRRGWPVAITADGETLALLAIETALGLSDADMTAAREKALNAL